MGCINRFVLLELLFCVGILTQSPLDEILNQRPIKDNVRTRLMEFGEFSIKPGPGETNAATQHSFFKLEPQAVSVLCNPRITWAEENE